MMMLAINDRVLLGWICEALKAIQTSDAIESLESADN
jgi:hypothetical protein